MTNAQIVLNASIELMEAGIIGTTGKVITCLDMEGNEVSMNEPEAIHTFATWKQMGYKIKKGSKAVAQFPIWTYKRGKKTEEAPADEEGKVEIKIQKPKMYMKNASWFSASQVEKIA